MQEVEERGEDGPKDRLLGSVDGEAGFLEQRWELLRNKVVPVASYQLHPSRI